MSGQQRIEPHPVSKLLTPEMKARVRAARFVTSISGVSEDSVGPTRRCPLAVAVEMDCSTRHWVYRALGVSQPDEAVEDFMRWADSMYRDPTDVYALLDCEDVS